MASPPAIARAGRSDWTLMTAIHDALRRDTVMWRPCTPGWPTTRRPGPDGCDARRAPADWPAAGRDRRRGHHGRRTWAAAPVADQADHLADKQADALPLISQIMIRRELGGIARAVRGGVGGQCATAMIPRALASATPDVCHQVLTEVPAPAPVSCTGRYGCRGTPALSLRCGEHPVQAAACAAVTHSA
jgi:hypothetical protein